MDPESGEHPASVTRTASLVRWISGRGYDEDNFKIDAKDSNPEALARWRESALVLNASRRFRYTANLNTRVKVSAYGFTLGDEGQDLAGSQLCEILTNTGYLPHHQNTEIQFRSY